MFKKLEIARQAEIESVNLYLNPDVYWEERADAYKKGFINGGEWADNHISLSMIEKILRLSDEFDRDINVDQFAFNQRLEYIQKHINKK